MNEVEETLRVIRDEISYHKKQLNSLDKTGKFIENQVSMIDEHKKNILNSIGFKMEYHNYKIIKLVDNREELRKKYNIGDLE